MEEYSDSCYVVSVEVDNVVHKSKIRGLATAGNTFITLSSDISNATQAELDNINLCMSAGCRLGGKVPEKFSKGSHRYAVKGNQSNDLSPASLD